MRSSLALIKVILGLASPTLLHGQVKVFANSPAPGDLFSNPSGSNQGQAVDATGWHYNNVRNSGEVGIRTDLPRSGNGSARFKTPSNTAKADIEYLASAVNISGNYFANGILAPFANLAAMAYDWYRASSSSVPGHLHPVMRVLLDADGNLSTTADRGGLVFELAYNGGGSTVTTDAWVSQPINNSSVLWGFGFFLPGDYSTTLATWKTSYPAAAILGFSLGVGSGWGGEFVGAVDNPNWILGATTTTSNFEVLPEPAAGAGFAGLGLLAFGIWRRRNSVRS